MLKRGYIILLVGAALVVIGISLSAAYGIGIASVILNESIILSDVFVDSSSTVNRTLDITNIERLVSIALHVESDASSDNSVVEQAIINPEGLEINKNEFGSQSDFLLPFSQR
jgi:hypothetical protein